MSQREHESKQHAGAADDEVSDAEEWVTTANEGNRAEDDGFRSTEGCYWIVCAIAVRENGKDQRSNFDKGRSWKSEGGEQTYSSECRADTHRFP